MSVETVQLNGRNCLSYYKMYLTNVEIEQPEVQTNYIQIPGRNGELDLTEALTGDVRYYNGKLTMTFQTAEQIVKMKWIEFWIDIKDIFHGKTATAVFEGYGGTFEGRCTVSGTPTAGGIYEIVIEMSYSPNGL